MTPAERPRGLPGLAAAKAMLEWCRICRLVAWLVRFATSGHSKARSGLLQPGWSDTLAEL